MGQPIRPSQFILSYGVGGIIETQRGPRLIPVFEKWDLSYSMFTGTANGPLRFRIEDRNAKAQLDGGEIFSLPTNPDFDLATARPIFRTLRFPRWALCQIHRILYQLDQYGHSRCPKCNYKLRDAQEEAIRFIRACPHGHMDDIDWHGTIHAGKNCDGFLFDWVEDNGSDLKSVRIRCRTCGIDVSLQDVYFRTSTCSGLFPEQGRREPCDEKAHVVLRSATSLRLPEVITSITIPPPALKAHLILSQPAIGNGLLGFADATPDPKSTLLTALRTISAKSPDQIDPATIHEIEEISPDEIKQAIHDLLASEGGNKTLNQVKDEEFTALQEAAVNGYPPEPSIGPLFEVEKSSVVRIPHTSGLSFRITPVKRLRVVLVQRGYRRPVRGPNDSKGHPAKLIETPYIKGGIKWYPGVALRGEGIFIDLPEGNPMLKAQRADIWNAREKELGNSPESYLFDPLFVWWHTLSHRIMYGLSIDSGYSSSALRERVYFRKKLDGSSEGGLLLYTSQQGTDGTLGGLIALCTESDFRQVLSASERNLYSCSNDPLCSKHSERNNGAACYACLFVSETSCEFRNSFLDRLLLAESFAKRSSKI